MNFLNKLLLAIAAMAVVSGSAFAKTADQNSNPGTSSPDVSDSYAVFTELRLLSFADILDLGVGADQQMVTVVVDADRRAPAESLSQAGGIYDLLLALSESPDATGSVFGAESSPDGSVIDLPSLLVPGAHAAPVPGTTDKKKMGDGFLFSVAAIPEPGDWMTLLCGFVVVAFMARRKTSAFAD